MGTAIKHPVPDRVKPSFVIFDIRALWRSGLSARVPGCQKLQMTVWHRMLYNCTHMATVGIKRVTNSQCINVSLHTSFRSNLQPLADTSNEENR